MGAIRLIQIAFFLAFGLVSGAAISEYCDHQKALAVAAVYLSLPPYVLSDIRI